MNIIEQNTGYFLALYVFAGLCPRFSESEVLTFVFQVQNILEYFPAGMQLKRLVKKICLKQLCAGQQMSNPAQRCQPNPAQRGIPYTAQRCMDCINTPSRPAVSFYYSFHFSPFFFNPHNGVTLTPLYSTRRKFFPFFSH